jgi:hypothetical protein
MLEVLRGKTTPPLGPIRGNDLEWIVAALFALLWIGIFILFGTRQRRYRKQRNREIAEKIVASLHTSIKRVPAVADQVRGLRHDELQQITAEFERLGFVQAGDYRFFFDTEEEERGFFRVFFHKVNHCFADVGVTRRTLDDGKGPLLFGISSSLDGGWGIGTGNGKPRTITYLWRLPKLVQTKQPGASPGKLLERHLELRDYLVNGLGLQVLTDSSVENWFARGDNTWGLRKEALLDRDIVADLREAQRVEKQGHWEWLGDYPQEAARRGTGKKLRIIPEAFPVYEVPQKDAVEQMLGSDVDSSEEDNHG